MEVQNICKYCNCVIEDDSFICTDKTFPELVNECKSNRQDQCKIEVENIKLGKPGVIKWLLKNTTPQKIDPENIDKIVDECVFSSEVEMIEILKKNQVYVKITKETEEEDEFYGTNERCALEDAVKTGNREIISWLLNLAINDNSTQFELHPYVIEAVRVNRLDNLQQLLSLGFDVTYSSFVNNECTVLEVAAENGHIEIIKWIFDSELISKDNFSFEIALHKALEKGHYDIVEYLVENVNVNINGTAKQYNEETVIHIAAKMKNINVIKWLLEKGAKLLAKDTHRQDIANIAIAKKDVNMLKWLAIQGVDLTAQRHRNRTLLHEAVSYQSIDCIKYLLHKGCDVNVKNSYDSMSALQCAVEYKLKIEYVKLLIDHGGDIHTMDCEKNTLLHSAGSNLEMLKLLVSMGLNIYSTNKSKQNILHCAAKRNNTDIVKWLLEQGMDVMNVLNCSYHWLESSYGPLIKKHDNTMLELCISYMKNIDQECDNGYSLLLNAAQYPEAVDIILKHKPNVNASVTSSFYHSTALLRSLTAHDKECKAAYSLIEAGADIKVKDGTGNNILFHAIKIQNINFIRKLIEQGVEINTEPNTSHTILGEAVHSQNMTIIKLLLESGANINDVNSYGKSALLCTGDLYNIDWNIVKYLIENGANPNQHCMNVDPILFTAMQSKDLELISWLLDHGANPNTVGKTKKSILHHCFLSFKNEANKLKCIKLLLNHNANINGLNSKGETLIFSVLDNLEMLDLLIRHGANINKQDTDGCTVLHRVLQTKNVLNSQNYIKIVLKLIHNGANVKIPDKKRVTPLHLAAANEHCGDIARLLVQKGADVNAKDAEGNSVLHVTCQGELAMWLCENGADINAKNDHGVSVLDSVIKRLPEKTVTSNLNIVPLLASRAINTNTKKTSSTQSLITSIDSSRYMKYLEFLVNKVENVEEKDNEGMTAIHYAVAKDNTFLVQSLFQSGVNILTKTDDGDTVLHSAAFSGSLNVATYILDHMKHELLMKGNDANETPLHLAIISNHVNIVKLLLKHGVEVDHKTNDNMTALHLACKNGNVEIVKLLLSNGANLYESSSNSCTPIHMAVQHCKFDVFEYLLEFELQNPSSECNVKLLQVKTDSDENLLHVAAKYGRLRNVPTKIMHYLINNQVYPIDSVDKLGNSALHHACCTYVSEAVELLVDNGANINLKNNTGNTPLHFAARTARVDIIKYLMARGGNSKIRNLKGNTPIHMAAAHVKTRNIIQYMVETIEDHYIKNRKGNTPLHHLAGCKREYTLSSSFGRALPYKLDIVNNKNRTPIHIGVKLKQFMYMDEFLNPDVINIVDIHGNTPLHIYLNVYKSIKKDIIHILYRLLASGADLTIQNKNEDTAVHIAVSILKPSHVETMLKYITDVNIKDQNGFNMLHAALFQMDLRIIQELFKTADLNAKSDVDENYLHVAVENPDLKVLEWIIPKCKSMINENDSVYSDTPLLKCVRGNFEIEVVELLVKNGADIHVLDCMQCSVLHLSCKENNLQLISYFIDLGVNVNLKDALGYAVLHYAVIEGTLDIVKKLIRNGADFNAVNDNGESILHIAARNNNLIVVQYLIQEVHCNFKLKCNNGFTAYDFAKKSGRSPHVVFWMLNNDYL